MRPLASRVATACNQYQTTRVKQSFDKDLAHYCIGACVRAELVLYNSKNSLQPSKYARALDTGDLRATRRLHQEMSVWRQILNLEKSGLSRRTKSCLPALNGQHSTAENEALLMALYHHHIAVFLIAEEN